MAENSGVVVAAAGPRSIAGIGAFRDGAALHAALQAEFHVAVPTVPGFIQAGEARLSCLGPGRYLASVPRNENFVAGLAKSLAGLAAITDQSDLWAVFVLSGPAVREVLARVVPVDVTRMKFCVGDLASTCAGHLDVRLWRIAEETYELAAARSYAEDLRHALTVASGVSFNQ